MQSKFMLEANIKYLVVILIVSLFTISQSETSKNAEAKFLIERMSGTKIPYDHSLILKVAAELELNDFTKATEIAIQHDNFLNLVVRDMAQKMSTRDETILSEFNDFTAMWIGVARDDADARDLLTANYSYKIDDTSLKQFMTSSPCVSPYTVPVHPDTYSETEPYQLVADRLNSNKHYKLNYENKCKNPNTGAIQTENNSTKERIFSDRSLGDILPKLNISNLLVKENIQKIIKEYTVSNGMGGTTTAKGEVPHPDPAGVLSLRAFGASHLIAGTNRRAVEFTMREFMCIPMEDWADSKASDERIGMDVPRFPGGSYEKFSTSCKACHTGMDGFRGAFAQYDFSGSDTTGFVKNGRIQTAEDGNKSGFDASTGVANKLNQNSSVFPNGFRVIDDSFINNATGAININTFGWRGIETFTGKGLNGFGNLIAHSERFSQCMVKRAYDQICNRALSFKDYNDLSYIKKQAQVFEDNAYRIKRLFINIASTPECFGGF